MVDDQRAIAAHFYDLYPKFPNDYPFYLGLIRSTTHEILELGCGTGRILIPLSQHCQFIQGIDKSLSMVTLCKEKLENARISSSQARVTEGDIAFLNLERQFDLILAPYRVLQNLETEAEITGLFKSIHSHLAQDGTCILNAFNPRGDRQSIIDRWSFPIEELEWEVPYEEGTLSCSVRHSRIDVDNMILYPELIYRVHSDEKVLEEVILPIAMKCYWPEEFVQIVENYGFKIRRKWGGYENQEYGIGPELVVEIEKDR